MSSHTQQLPEVASLTARQTLIALKWHSTIGIGEGSWADPAVMETLASFSLLPVPGKFIHQPLRKRHRGAVAAFDEIGSATHLTLRSRPFDEILGRIDLSPL
jgi:hypothetical protein